MEDGGFLSAVAINMSSRRGPPSSQNRMTEGGLKLEDGKKRQRWKSGKGVQDKHGLDSAGDTSCERRSEASVGSETKRNGERRRNILSQRRCFALREFSQRKETQSIQESRLKTLAQLL